MENLETQLAYFRAHIETLSLLCRALIRAHPQKEELLGFFDSFASARLDQLLDTSATDAEIDLAKSLIEVFRNEIRPYASPLP